MTTLSIDSLTTNPVGSENGLIVRNIPSGIQDIEITDGYGNILGTSDNPIQTSEANRTTLVFIANFSGINTPETMITFTPYTNFTAGSSATSFPITLGKKFRIQSILCSSSTGNLGTIKLRISDTGTVTTSTPIIIPAMFLPQITFPEGLELSGSMQFGMSQVYNLSTTNFGITIIGYEY